MGQDEAARALADGQGLDDLEVLSVDQAQAVVLFVGDKRGKRQRRGRRQGECETHAGQTRRRRPVNALWNFLLGIFLRERRRERRYVCRSLCVRLAFGFRLIDAERVEDA